MKQRLWILLLALLAAPLAPASQGEPAAALTLPGHVLMLRHANAPGSGDPPNFRLEDCRTQRNLDAGGRAQAAAAGDWLRRNGVKQARIYSSQWCRCLETARLLDLGPVTPLPALNNIFTRPQDSDANMRALREFLAAQPADGPLLILVSHYVNIQLLSGTGVGSGEGMLLRLNPGQAPGVVGRVRLGD